VNFEIKSAEASVKTVKVEKKVKVRCEISFDGEIRISVELLYRTRRAMRCEHCLGNEVFVWVSAGSAGQGGGGLAQVFGALQVSANPISYSGRN
jgi:hypothetical protein